MTMRAIERTTRQFVAAVQDAAPGLQIQISRSCTDYGRSNYVYLCDHGRRFYRKVRISDHSVGMRRAMSGREDLYIHAKTKSSSWSVWLGELRRQFGGDSAGGQGALL